MLNVSEAVRQAYINGNAKTEIFLTVTTTDGVVHKYNPRNILSGSVSVVESLCTSDNFDLSRVEKNQLTFTLFNITENISDLQGASVVAKQRVYTDASDDTVYTDIPLGVYTVDTAELDGVYLYKCTCFDSTMLAFDAVIDDWWNTTVTFPITIKNLAIALFRYLNVPYSLPETFTNYDYQLTSRNAYFQQIKASELLGYMQEVVAGYFKADRQGVIHLKSAVLVPSGLYPHIGLYPREGLYPRPSNRAFGEEDTAGVGDWNYPQIVGDLTVADYTAKNVTKLQIRSSDNDIGIIVGNGTNTYVIQGNPLLYNLTDETGSPIAQAILDAVKHVNYRPFTGKFMAMPFVEVGDVAKVTTLNGRTFDSPIFQRTLSGAHLAFDNFVSPGYEYREQVKDTNRLLMTLNNTTHEIVNSVDTLSSTITNVQSTISGFDARITTNTSNITQNSSQIALKVSQSDYTGANIVNLINLDTSGATIQAAHVVVDTSSLDLTFGSATSNVTIKSTDENDGVLFDGSGKVHFETNGQFQAKNLDSNDEQANHIILTNNSEESSAEIYNYFGNVRANDIDFTANSNSNKAVIVNNKLNEDINASLIRLEATSTGHSLQLYNFNFNGVSGRTANSAVFSAASTTNTITFNNNKITTATETSLAMNLIKLHHQPGSNWNQILIQNNWMSGTRSNWIQCSNANTTSDFQFWNYNTSGQYANTFTMTSNGDSNFNNVTLSNYNTSSQYANTLTMSSNSSSNSNTVTLSNRNTSATQVNSITLYSTTTDTQNYVYLMNMHNNGNLANTIYMHSENNSGALAIANKDSSGNTRTALYMNADGTFKVQTLVNNSQKCLIQASSYGNLDLVTTGALHFNAGSITVQYGNTYKTGAGSGGNPTGTDNVAVKNWDNSTVNLHFANGLYIGWSKAS